MDDSADLSDLTLAILAGGEGRRMGFPKGNLRIGEQPILTYLLDRIAWPGPTLLVTTPGRERPPGCERFDAEAVDPVAGEGPLRGVLTALRHAKTPIVIFSTVDMANIQLAQLQWLAEKLIHQPAMFGCMMSRPTGACDQIEPFPFACRTTASELIENRLAQGRRSMHSLSQLQGFFIVPSRMDWPVSVWANLNSPADLKDIEQAVE